MYKRFVIILVLILVTIIFTIPARAAGTPWTAWLYENQTGRMTQVDSNGNVLKQIQLPSGQGEGYSQNAAVSQDGGLVAYGGTSPNTNNVYIFNLATSQNVFEFNVPQNAQTSLEFNGSPLSYSENNGTFAFSYGGVGIQWTLVVIDIKTLSVTSLKQSDPAAAGLSDNGMTFIPAITSNRNQQIAFLMIPYGVDGAPTYKSFTWNRDTNSVSPNTIYSTLDTATFIPTGEVLTAVSDNQFPDSHMPDTGFPQNNTLRVFDPKLNQDFVLTSLGGIYTPQFVQSSERVAINHYYNQSDGSQVQMMLLVERTGVVSNPVGGIPQTGLNVILGTQDGFIFSNSNGGDPKTSSTTLYYVETRQAKEAFSATQVWSSAPGINGRLVWDSDLAPVITTVLPQWTQMQPPAGNDGAGVNVTTGIPVGDSAYAVGVTARVQTTNNDVLNLRSGPGTTFQRLGIIANGTLVVLIEGPQTVDGIPWWRVRLPTGFEGWVASQADGINTLIPQ